MTAARRSTLLAPPRRCWGLRVSLGLCAALLAGCAHVEPGAPAPEAPAAAPATAPDSAPETTLRVSSAPIESLRSAHFAAIEVTFENPSGEWHQVRRVFIGPERQLFGPELETPVGERLRAWQLASRAARQGKVEAPPHPALDTLAPDAAAKDAGDSARPGAPPDHLLAYPFTIAPGLSLRKWVLLYSAARDGLLGQDLVLAYELEDGQIERVLVKYPKPSAAP